jgi:signal transduction histidine kinase
MKRDFIQTEIIGCKKMDDHHRSLNNEDRSEESEIRITEAPGGSTERNDIPRSPTTLSRTEHQRYELPHPHVCRRCLGAMTHRLSQSITALRGGLELALMSDRSPADYRRVVEQSLQLADDLAKLVVSLRDLGEAGVAVGTPQLVLLDATAAEVLAEMETSAQLRELRMEMGPQRGVKICVAQERLREALQSLIAWTIENSAGGVLRLDVSRFEEEAHLMLSPPRLDLQYLQIKILDDGLVPGSVFAHAARTGALGWAISRRLFEALGGTLEILTEGADAGYMRVRFPIAKEQ